MRTTTATCAEYVDFSESTTKCSESVDSRTTRGVRPGCCGSGKLNPAACIGNAFGSGALSSIASAGIS